MCCPHLVSAGLWLLSTTGIHWNFIGAKVIQLHMLYTQTHTHTHTICRSAECSEARAWAVFSCLDLEWPRALRSFCDTISPALRRGHSQIWCLPQLWVPRCVCDDVGICSLFLLWPLLRMCQYTCITQSHPPWMFEFPSQKLSLVCITHCCHLLYVVPEILSNLAFLLSLIIFHICNCAFQFLYPAQLGSSQWCGSMFHSQPGSACRIWDIFLVCLLSLDGS